MIEHNKYQIKSGGKMDRDYKLVKTEIDKLINNTKEENNIEVDSENYELKNNRKTSNQQPKLLFKFAGYKLYFNRKQTWD